MQKVWGINLTPFALLNNPPVRKFKESTVKGSHYEVRHNHNKCETYKIIIDFTSVH